MLIPTVRERSLANNRMQLTKREVFLVGAPSRAVIIKSRFAADSGCSALKQEARYDN